MEKTQVSILISDKVISEQRKLPDTKSTLHHDTRVSPPRRHSNPKRVCTKQYNCKTKPKLIKLKGGIGKSRIMVGDFNTSLSIINRTKQKTSKDIKELNTINEQNLISFYRTLQKAEYTFFSSAHGLYTQTDHILGHKINFNKLKRVGIIQSVLSDKN